MTTRHRLVYFGSSQLSAEILEYVLSDMRDHFEVVAVVTQAQKPHAHAHQADTPVAVVASDRNLPLIRPTLIADELQAITSLEADIGLLFAYGQILPSSLIDIFPRGIVNIHPSLLPKHRGPSPIEATLLEGDTEAGTSIMLITERMDAGPILKQASFSIVQHISKQDLTQKLMSASRKILQPALLGYLSGELQAQPQNESDATYCQLIHKNDGHVDLAHIHTDHLLRMIRAFQDWPGVTIPLPGRADRLRIHQAALIKVKTPGPGVYQYGKQMIIATMDGTLEALNVQLPGRKSLAAHEALNGLRLPVLPIK